MSPDAATAESPTQPRVNVADRLAEHARERPDNVAVVAMHRGASREITFAELDRDATRLAQGLVACGVEPGLRLALLVKPGIEFVSLVFALLRSGATMVLVDGGLGRKNIVRCLESTKPDGFVAIPQGHVLRVLMQKKFPNAKLNVTVGRRWFWGGETLEGLRKRGTQATPPTIVGGSQIARASDDSRGSNQPNTLPQTAGPQTTGPHTSGDDPAAIVFTSGSTGPPKGVVYRHETFVTQADEIQRQYDLQPGAVDLACFPLFGLFNVACGVTTVLPEMDFSRPASCDPQKLFSAANQWKVSQSFASPAVWDKLSRHAEQTGERIPTLRKIFSCGAPVPAKVIRRTLAMVHSDAASLGVQLHTPYGATESLPVATIEAQEILTETAAKTDQGAGVCVGRKFDSLDWRVIRITDEPIATIDLAEELPEGEIGELIVRGPQVSRAYLGEPEASAPGATNQPTHNAIAKITDGDSIWHRIGDVGYLDDQQRFWYCGRKSQRVVTSEGTFYTECVESQINANEWVAMSALVGVLDSGTSKPVILFHDDSPVCFNDPRLMVRDDGALEIQLVVDAVQRIVDQIFSPLEVEVFWSPKRLPTDIRHNSKIRREELAVWAEKQLRK